MKTRVGVSSYQSRLKKSPPKTCFPVNIVNFLRTTFYKTFPVAASVEPDKIKKKFTPISSAK